MNLIVTCPRHFESETADEIGHILEDIGDDHPKIQKSKLSGILMIDTKIESNQVLHRIRKKIHDEPWSIRYILRVIPIQKWIVTNMDEIISESQRLSKKIQKDQKYRITVEKRNSKISSQEIITNIANQIKRKVSLEEPDWIILVEIFGTHTGLSVITYNDILSVKKEKRAISD